MVLKFNSKSAFIVLVEPTIRFLRFITFGKKSDVLLKDRDYEMSGDFLPLQYYFFSFVVPSPLLLQVMSVFFN